MKAIQFVYLYPLLSLLILLGLGGCNSSSAVEGIVITPQQINDVPVIGDTYKVSIRADKPWDATVSADWLSVNMLRGINGIMTLTVKANLNEKPREATITLRNETSEEVITVAQLGGELSESQMDSIQYTLPVVFHVLYNKDSVNQRVPQEVLQRLMIKVNQLYRGEIANREQTDYAIPDKNDMAIQFALAAHGPDGNLLPEPGINRVEIPENELPYEKVMNDPAGGPYHRLAWDKTKYINIFLFQFKKDVATTGAGIVLGVAHMPYAPNGVDIEGLLTYNEASLRNYNHCVVINSKGIYSNRPSYSTGYRATVDAATTIAHELAHYLGLYHVFAEEHSPEGNRMVDQCIDSDYCSDTKSYNRVSYQQQLLRLGPSPSYSEIVGFFSRTNCAGERFPSYNIMDYEFTDSFHFTSEQRRRMRQCLYYSPVVPGQKHAVATQPALRSSGVPVKPIVCVCGGNGLEVHVSP